MMLKWESFVSAGNKYLSWYAAAEVAQQSTPADMTCVLHWATIGDGQQPLAVVLQLQSTYDEWNLAIKHAAQHPFKQGSCLDVMHR